MWLEWIRSYPVPEVFVEASLRVHAAAFVGRPAILCFSCASYSFFVAAFVAYLGLLLVDGRDLGAGVAALRRALVLDPGNVIANRAMRRLGC